MMMMMRPPWRLYLFTYRSRRSLIQNVACDRSAAVKVTTIDDRSKFVLEISTVGQASLQAKSKHDVCSDFQRIPPLR